MQRAAGTVLVALLVVLAGCSGFFGGGGDGGSEPASTITPAPVPTDEPTPTPAPQLAPGLTGEGIENASALVAAHTSVLQNRSFTTRTNTTRLTANDSVIFRQTRTLRAGPSGEGVYSVFKSDGSDGYPRSEAVPVRYEAWSNDGQLLVNQTYANGTTRYDRVNSTGIRHSAAGAQLRYFLEPLGTANTSVAELERNGTTVYRVRGRVLSAERGNVSVRLVVDSRGVVREYRSVRQAPFEANSRIVTERRFSAIGTTDVPERPSWIDEALNRTTPVSNRTAMTSNAMTATTATATNRTGTTDTTTADTTTRR